MKRIIRLYILAASLIVGLACNTINNLNFDLDLAQSTVRPQRTSAPLGEATPFYTGEAPSDETLLVLQQAIVPENNPIELADRFLGIENVPDSIPAPARPFEVGDRRDFWVTDTDTDETFQTEAVLRYAGDILYFWVEDGVQYDDGDLTALAQTFEDHIVPTDREFFGSEWNPGVDNDPHIYILYTTGIGFQTAGYFSSQDEINPLAEESSNAAEMFVLNADNSELWDEYTYGVLAHEFQHMIHWYRDRNETSWLNEGMSELATLLNGYYHGGFIYEYTFDPDLQLNDWPNDPDATTPHYGAGFLFVTYFLERFGDEATQALVADPANGLESIDNVLLEIGAVDPQTGKPITADDVVLDWTLANYLADGAVSDGRYSYPTYPQMVEYPTTDTEFVDDCGTSGNPRDVRQYGVDYIRIACSGQVTLRFEGATSTELLPASPYSGDYAFWTNKGDESDMTLTREFDFTNVSGPITLTYRTWYDIEEDWDYVYVLTSTNDGDDWEFMTTPSGTDTDPTGNSFGWGYTGLSGDSGEWIQESVDLSEFAGQQVLVRFEYITDAAVNGEGLLIDDIAVDAIDYFEDFETGDGGWVAEGFARVTNVLPQTFRLALISFGSDTTVDIIEVPATNVLELPLEFGGEVDEVTLVVMGSTLFTRQPAGYNFTFTQ